MDVPCIVNATLANGNLPATVLFAVAVGLLTLLLLRRSGRYFNRSASRHASDSPDHANVRGGSAEFDRWEVRMHETARDLSAQLDSKIVALEQLLRQARQERQRLEATLVRLERIKAEGQ